MKQRVISGVFIALITIVSVVLGGHFLWAVCLLINAYGSYELVKCVRHKFDFWLYLVMVLSTMGIYLFFDKTLLIVLLEIIILFTFSVFDEFRPISDLSVILLMSIIIGCSTYFIIYLRNISMFLLGYVVIISYLTDVFAYFIGYFFGKNKLNERVSPNKTIEGAIGGWICGAIFSLIWAIIFDFFNVSTFIMVLACILLPVISQIGDLAYSLLKRHYEIKDFSNLIPGHGGLLDRLDSMTFVLCFIGILLMISR